MMFMVRLHQQMNATSDSFVYKTFGACLITMIIQIKVENQFWLMLEYFN